MTLARVAFVSALAVVALASPTPRVIAQSSAGDIVLRPGQAAMVAGGWTVVSDPTAAGGVAVRHADAGAPKLAQPLAQPVHYFEVSFDAQAGVPYRLWMRGRADGNHWANDSVFVQLSGSADASGTARARIGTTSAYEVNLEDCSGCRLSGWGWQDNGWGVGVLGPEIFFAATGSQRMRVQTREDGLTIDQIVLSPSRYLMAAPGALKNDTTIVPLPGTSTVTLVRRPYLQQMSATGGIVVWATREPGTPAVRIAGGSTNRTVSGTSRRVAASTNGLGFDYYHHEVRLTGLAAATSYVYDATLGGAAVASAGFRTAPAVGGGAFSFVAFGDSGTGSSAQRQLASVMAADTFDLAFHTGDIVYGKSDGTGDASYRTYNEWFFDIYAAWLPFRAFVPSQGNHDSRPSNGNGIAYLDAFTLPANGATPPYPDHAERFYSFDYGPAHVVVLDTEFAFQDVTRRAEQQSWLEADLASTTQAWKIAIFHRSPYSAGGEHGSDLAVRSAFSPIFERYGVQVVLSAHEHTYERTRPTRESPTGHFVTYVVTGGGGAPLYPAGTASWTAYSASRHHYVRGDVTECTLTLRAVGLDGKAFDSSTLNRCTAPPPTGEEDVILYAAEAPVVSGGWRVETDSTAAGGRVIRHPDAGAPKLSAALSQPAHYFEMTFNATPGVPYRLWMRSKAERNHWSNDSVFVQFDRTVDSAGRAVFRIGTAGSTEVNLEDCSGCGLSGWGWQDNGWGVGVLGPPLYFAGSGTQRMRVQTREDGLSLDQIVLSPARYLTSAPGALKNDTTILGMPAMPPPPAPTGVFKVLALNLKSGMGMAADAFFNPAASCSHQFASRVCGDGVNAWTSGFTPGLLASSRFGADPDLIAVILNDANRTAGCGNADDVRRALGWTSGGSYHPSSSRGIVARYGIVPGTTVNRNVYSETSGAGTRYFALTRAKVYVDAATTQAMWVVSAYMQPDDYSAAGAAQALVAFVNENPGEPTIVGGDLNLSAGAEAGWSTCVRIEATAYNVLRNAMVDAWAAVHGQSSSTPGFTGMLNRRSCTHDGVTWKNADGRLYKRVDYLWSRNLPDPTAAEVVHEPYGNCQMSDHAALKASWPRF